MSKIKESNLTIMVLEDFDINDIENSLKPENIVFFEDKPKHVIMATSNGVFKDDGTIDVTAHVQGKDYDVLSRMFMIVASGVHDHFIENIKDNECEEE